MDSKSEQRIELETFMLILVRLDLILGCFGKFLAVGEDFTKRNVTYE